LSRSGGRSTRPRVGTGGRAAVEIGGVSPADKAIVADRGYPVLNKLAAKQGLMLDTKAPPKGTSGFTPIAPLYRLERAFARLGRWRRLSRCDEGSAASAYLFARLRVEPA
jgi:hypothetical protein